MNTECTEALFLKDVAEHRMTVLREDGLYRHVRFSKPNSSEMAFDLITWPGHICYTGDMGTYTFQRLGDMFGFFRSDSSLKQKDGKTLFVNPGYWAEKCTSANLDGVSEYSEPLFRETIQNWLDECEASEKVREEVESMILSRANEGEYAARQAVFEFECDDFEFADFGEVNLQTHTFHYLWCCYALAWSVAQYDLALATAASPGM